MKRLTHTESYSGNSAYLYIPKGTSLNLSCEHSSLARIHKSIPANSCAVYKTLEGYSWQKEHFLLIPRNPNLLTCLDNSPHWHYVWEGEVYPALAVPIDWAELNFAELFS